MKSKTKNIFSIKKEIVDFNDKKIYYKKMLTKLNADEIFALTSAFTEYARERGLI